MNKYRKKPVEVEAARWQPSELTQPEPHCRDSENVIWQYDAVGQVANGIIQTLSMDIVVHPGDWIIYYNKTVSVCCDEMFQATYEKVEE